jgi:hypothetical protein
MRRSTLISVLLAIPAILLVGNITAIAYSSYARDNAAKRMLKGGYASLISPYEIEPIKVISGRTVSFKVTVCNIGNQVWPEQGKVALGLFDRRLKDILTGWERHGNNPILAITDQLRFPPETDVVPSRTFRAHIEFAAPLRPGRYHMRLQMVDESKTDEDGQPLQGRWFGDMLRFELDVSSAAGVPPAA